MFDIPVEEAAFFMASESMRIMGHSAWECSNAA
jgi:hypothetical protein